MIRPLTIFKSPLITNLITTPKPRLDTNERSIFTRWGPKAEHGSVEENAKVRLAGLV